MSSCYFSSCKIQNCYSIAIRIMTTIIMITVTGINIPNAPQRKGASWKKK